uniref:Uncharacterized protein n=1 Tax=Anguilla anguilla TaxID=7936 RepID=A0A0E9WAH8_ANGAN
MWKQISLSAHHILYGCACAEIKVQWYFFVLHRTKSTLKVQ